MNIDTILDQIFILPRDSKSVLKDLISEVEFPKDSIIIKAGKVEKTIYFIKKGIVRAFVPQENQDVTFWFGKEGDVVLPMKSYVDSHQNYENIHLLEDSILYRLEISALRELYSQYSKCIDGKLFFISTSAGLRNPQSRNTGRNLT